MTEILLGACALGLLWAVMVLGVYLTYRILDIADLSVEGTIGLGAAVAASLMTNGINPWLATLLAFAAGLLGGLVTGILHTVLRIPALLSGILTMIALWSINLRVMGGSNGRSNISLLRTNSIYTPLQKFLEKSFGLQEGSGKTLATLLIGLVFVFLVAVILYWFFGTELGSAIRATGSNSNMARAQGINTAVMVTLGLMVSNGLVGLSGALIAQYQSFSDIQMGQGSIVIGLASLIIGEVLFGKRSFKNSLIAVILGAVVYRLIIALVLRSGLLNPNDLKLFTAITVAVCLATPMLTSRYKAAKKSASLSKEIK